MLNDTKSNNFISISDTLKYLPKDQLDYLYFNSDDIIRFCEDPLVKIGFNGVKGVITPESVYNYNKYGIKGVSSNLLFNNEIVYDDIGIGDL